MEHSNEKRINLSADRINAIRHGATSITLYALVEIPVGKVTFWNSNCQDLVAEVVRVTHQIGENRTVVDVGCGLYLRNGPNIGDIH